MSTSTSNLRLTGGDVLTQDSLQTSCVSVAGGLFAPETSGRDIDASGFMILPGIVDIHGDGFERHIAPRRGALRSLEHGLTATDAELASNGITTATLAQFYSWEGGLRRPDFAERLLTALDACRADLLTDIRIQLRFETHMLDEYDAVLSFIDRFQIPYVVFNDHVPHDALAKGKKPPRLTGQALKSRRSPEAHLELLKQMHADSDKVPEKLAGLSAELAERGILRGTHDDRTPQQRDWAHDHGITIAEFPETPEAAARTRELGGHIILGAPNVMRGGSHAGNVSALDLVKDGLCDVLASDYHYPSLRLAAFEIVDQGLLPLERAWPLISKHPAQTLGLMDRGEIKDGLRADFIVLDPSTRRVEATCVAGTFTYMSGRFVTRVL